MEDNKIYVEAVSMEVDANVSGVNEILCVHLDCGTRSRRLDVLDCFTAEEAASRFDHGELLDAIGVRHIGNYLASIGYKIEKDEE